MNFVGSLKLTELSLQPDKEKRTLFKSFMNSIVGKLSQRPTYAHTKFVRNADEIDEVVASGNKITNFTNISPEICQLDIESDTSSTRFQRKTNPVLSAFVTALSRINMHEHILMLTHHDFLPLYTDTDSIIFCGPDKNVPLPISKSLGDFKHEYDNELSAFCCIGKKNYAITQKKKRQFQESFEESDFKVRGLSFKSSESREALSFQDFELFLRDQVQSISVPQTRLRKSKELQIRKKIIRIRLAKELNFNRVLTNSPHFQTVPYGFVQE